MAQQQFDEIVSCRVISLARTPQRRQRFLAINAVTGVAFNIFEAVDGTTFSEAEAIARQAIAPGTLKYTPGAIGNGLSHRTLWEEAIRTNRQTIIFEDDAILRHDFKSAVVRVLDQVRPNWDFISLGYNLNSLVTIEFVPGSDASLTFSKQFLDAGDLAEFAGNPQPFLVHRLRHSFGTCGYLVSPKGAAKLRAAVFPMDNRRMIVPGTPAGLALTFDHCMNTVYPKIRAYACVPPLVLTPNEQATRTV